MRLEEEEVRAVALGTTWVAAATSLNFLRIFSDSGLQVCHYLNLLDSNFMLQLLYCVTSFYTLNMSRVICAFMIPKLVIKYLFPLPIVCRGISFHLMDQW